MPLDKPTGESAWEKDPEPNGIALSLLHLLDLAGVLHRGSDLDTEDNAVSGGDAWRIRPHLSPGVIEQGIYTWSSSNLNGVQGRGFGAASRGLLRHVKWLGELDQEHFRLSTAGYRTALTDTKAGSSTALSDRSELTPAVSSIGSRRGQKTIPKNGRAVHVRVHLAIGKAGQLDTTRRCGPRSCGRCWRTPLRMSP